jgi:hypothetical protein
MRAIEAKIFTGHVGLPVRPGHLALVPDAIGWRPIGKRNQ